MDPRVAAARVERLREIRNRPVPDLTLERTLDDLARGARKRVRDLGGVDRAWRQVVPRALAAHCRIERLSRGVLTVRSSDAAAKFEIDRWLRSGGERQLIVGGVAIKRIKVL